MKTLTKTNGWTMRTPAALLPVAVVLFASQNSVGQTDAAQRPAKSPIAIAITVETPTVKAGTGVSIRASLTNNSDRPLDASGCYCGPSGLDSAFTWEVRDSSGHLASKRVYPHPEVATGSPILDRIIAPGGDISGDQDVSRLYDMTKPGKYLIQASREVPKDMGGGVVKSNVVTVTVAP
jgi:hypothetical protein